MRVWAVLAGVALVVSGCSASGSTAPAASPSATATVLDDGAFAVSPVDDRSSAISPEQVRQDLVLSYEQNVQKLGPLTFGTVHWGPGVWSTPPGMAEDRLAWVQFWQDETDLMPDDPRLHGCSGAATGFGTRPSPTPVSQPSRQHALVVDAESGAAAIYDGAGPSACLLYQAPFAFLAVRTDSVPWKALGSGRVSVTLPPCGVDGGGWRNTLTTWQALSSRGFGACDGKTTSQVWTGLTHLPSGHAPIGPLCARIAAGVPLVRPSDCVN